MLELQMVLTYLKAHRQSVRESMIDSDRGDILQTVVIVGLFVAGAIIVVGILVNKAKTAANSVKTQ